MPHICIVVATFYKDLASVLVQGARAQLLATGATVDVVEVPGAFEIPAAVRLAIESKKYEGYLGLGCVIRGETSHYDYVCAESARGLNQLAIEFMAPIGYGILTVENEKQAWVRAAIEQGNKGKDAAEACLAMLAIKQQMKGK